MGKGAAVVEVEGRGGGVGRGVDEGEKASVSAREKMHDTETEKSPL